MSGQPALHSEASSTRLLVLDGASSHDVFDVLGVASDTIRVRSAYLFEVGEELSVRIEVDGTVSEATARVRAHLGPDDAPITELEILDRSEPRQGELMLVGDLDEVDYDLEVDGEQVRRTLHRKVWERGAWATVAIAYEERGPEGAWKPARLALIRLQRVRDAWKKHAAITLRGDDAIQLADALRDWSDAFAPPGTPEPDE